MNEEIDSIMTDDLKVEIYKDVFKASAVRVGASLESLVKVALSPVSLVDIGIEETKVWLGRKIRERHQHTPSEYLVKPKARIALAAIQHISFTHDEPNLRELYAELLLKAMDARTEGSVHLSFFSILEQISPEEALILKALHKADSRYFESLYDHYGCDQSERIEKKFQDFCEKTLGEDTSLSDVWLRNLCRLGILEESTSIESVYRDDYFEPPKVNNIEYRLLGFSALGDKFIQACCTDLS